MAEILIAAVDSRRYQRGDPVAVFENGHTWSDLELLPPKDGGSFARLIVTDVGAQAVRNRLRPLMEQAQPGDIEFDAPDEADRFVKRARSAWRLLLSDIPRPVLNSLNNQGFYETDLLTLRQYIRRKVYNRQTDSVEDGIEEEF